MRDVSESVRLAVEEWYLTNTHLEDWESKLITLSHEQQEWIESNQIKASSIVRVNNRFYIPTVSHKHLMFHRIWIPHVRDIGAKITINRSCAVKNSLLDYEETIAVLQRT